MGYQVSSCYGSYDKAAKLLHQNILPGTAADLLQKRERIIMIGSRKQLIGDHQLTLQENKHLQTLLNKTQILLYQQQCKNV